MVRHRTSSSQRPSAGRWPRLRQGQRQGRRSGGRLRRHRRIHPGRAVDGVQGHRAEERRQQQRQRARAFAGQWLHRRDQQEQRHGDDPRPPRRRDDVPTAAHEDRRQHQAGRQGRIRPAPGHPVGLRQGRSGLLRHPPPHRRQREVSGPGGSLRARYGQRRDHHRQASRQHDEHRQRNADDRAHLRQVSGAAQAGAGRRQDRVRRERPGRGAAAGEAAGRGRARRAGPGDRPGRRFRQRHQAGAGELSEDPQPAGDRRCR